MKARRQDQQESPWDYWRVQHKTVLRDVVLRGNGVSSYELREALYRRVKECTQFKPSLAVSVFQRLNATRVLDFSAGWGDRLVAALASPDVVRYLAFDPNVSLRDGHASIVRTFVADESRRARYSVVYEPFEKATIAADETFDLVFTSPPFFDFESYTSLPGQSASAYPQRDEWLVRFLFVSLAKSWQRLVVGGHLAIHITDVYKTQVCEPMLLYMQWQLPDAQYRGVMASLGDAGKPRPIWVWRKQQSPSSNTPNPRITLAANYLQQYFPLIYRKIQNQNQ